MPRLAAACAALAVAMLLPALAAAQTRDVAGAKDYPGIGRFAGSVITGYEVKDFDAVRLQAAPFRDGKPVDARTARRPRHPHRLSHRPGPLDPRGRAQFREPARQGRLRDAARLRRRRLRRHSVRRGGRRAADPADVDRRLQLPLLRRPQGTRAGARPMSACWSARTTTTSMRSSPSSIVGAHREQDGRRRRDGEGSRREAATSRSTASISTPTRRW